jgi:predicted transcriptional regulator
MSESSKYWNLVRIDAAAAGGGYKLQSIYPAQEFFAQQFLDINSNVNSDDAIQLQLLHESGTDKATGGSSKTAELCLRCYVSHSILQACQRRARLFGPGNGFTYRDLLPFVLNDDGTLQSEPFTPFAVEILQSYQLQHRSSLAKWTDLRVRRNPELNQFLLECGLRFSSDWALLNRANPKDYESIDRHLVDVFHIVYRRDRPQQHRQGVRQKCSDPTDAQLDEMIRLLRQHQVFIHSSRSLLSQLKRIAQDLRQEDIWGRRGFPVAEPLETTDPDTGETSLKEIADHTYSSDPEVAERAELQTFCYEQLLNCLDRGIRDGIGDRVYSLKQRPRYAHLAHQVKPALRLLYFENKSQGQIAPLLGMTNQAQVSRILNPKELLFSIRQRTLEALLHRILDKVRELKVTEFPVSPDYLKNLMQQLDAFVDEQVFEAALAEINVSRNRSMDSLYAHHLRQILNELEVSPAA